MILMLFRKSSYFWLENGMAAMVAPKDLGPQDPTKKLAHWGDLLGQQLSRKPISKHFGTEPPAPNVQCSTKLILKFHFDNYKNDREIRNV